MRADFFVTPVLAPFLGPNRLFSFYSVLGIELFKTFKKKKRKKSKTKKNQKSGLSQFLFLQQKMKYVDLMAIFIIFLLHNLAAFCQCQCHSSCVRTWSIRQRRRQGSSLIGLQISRICNFYSFL